MARLIPEVAIWSSVIRSRMAAAFSRLVLSSMCRFKAAVATSSTTAKARTTAIPR